MSDDTRTLPEQEIYTPNDIAVYVFGEGHAFQGAKQIRDYLRARYGHKHVRNTSWLLTPEVAADVIAQFESRKIATVITLDDDTDEA